MCSALSSRLCRCSSCGDKLGNSENKDSIKRKYKQFGFSVHGLCGNVRHILCRLIYCTLWRQTLWVTLDHGNKRTLVYTCDRVAWTIGVSHPPASTSFRNEMMVWFPAKLAVRAHSWTDKEQRVAVGRITPSLSHHSDSSTEQSRTHVKVGYIV